jgi:phosphatidylinositol glycan class B
MPSLDSFHNSGVGCLSHDAWQEWRTQLRSSLHPRLFAVVYRVAASLAHVCGLTLAAKAELLLIAPKVAQAVFAALLDGYTWKLAEKAYSRGSRTALAAVGHVLQLSSIKI